MATTVQKNHANNPIEQLLRDLRAGTEEAGVAPLSKYRTKSCLDLFPYKGGLRMDTEPANLTLEECKALGAHELAHILDIARARNKFILVRLFNAPERAMTALGVGIGIVNLVYEYFYELPVRTAEALWGASFTVFAVSLMLLRDSRRKSERSVDPHTVQKVGEDHLALALVAASSICGFWRAAKGELEELKASRKRIMAILPEEKVNLLEDMAANAPEPTLMQRVLHGVAHIARPRRSVYRHIMDIASAVAPHEAGTAEHSAETGDGPGESNGHG